MGQLDGKTAVVTGGSSGIGLATAKRFAAEGAHVFVTGRGEVALRKAAAEIGDATPVVGDVGVAADLDRLYDQVRERGQGLDVLFANAALNLLGTIEEFTDADFDRVFDTNVKGTFHTVQKALPLFNPGASVVLASSTSAGSGADRFGFYGASKAAVRAFGRTWAGELAGRGVRVNVITPGPTDTTMFEDVFGAQADELRARIGAGLPAQRIGDPDEIASAVLFLASSHSSYAYGADLQVDGGQLQV
ncbi:SDR family NAD(P)-dependent oxidoreductase [Pseudonocardia sp. ICBG1293]|uniref:SDR family NAD(P)-dependent oxidoreductase n=1 Tax=Pseudonocardia sp. ICBG1293 TaxID=2844382 RepID=UPI001CD0091E|nr:SDR family oxidoreductase [Pseudonocardia sp. ICBG1293]